MRKDYKGTKKKHFGGLLMSCTSKNKTTNAPSDHGDMLQTAQTNWFVIDLENCQ